MVQRTFPLQALDRLFAPRSVALVGASTTPGRWGMFVLHNLLKDGFEGKVYAVGRPGAKLFGLDFHGSLDEISEPLDLVLVMVPAAAAIGEVERAVRRGAKAIYVVSGGFGETGTAQGQAAEKRLHAIAAASAIPIVGPNGQGVLNTHRRFCGQMFFTTPPVGRISLVTQSGNVGVVLTTLSVQCGVGMSKVVSTGNAACVDLADFVEYLATDPDTSVICLYAEGTQHGRPLLDAIAYASARKPVLVLKAGNSAAGTRAASSHSAAMASNGAVFGDACRGAGALVVGSIVELWDAACMLAAMPAPRGPRVGILTLGGGLGVVTADLVAGAGLQVAPLPPALLARLDTILPSRWSRGNPVDTTAADSSLVAPVLRAMVELGELDVLLYVGFGENDIARYMMQQGALATTSPIPEICAQIERQEHGVRALVRDFIRDRQMPIVGIADVADFAHQIPNAAIVAHAREGFVTYPTPERGVQALRHLYAYHAARAEERP